MEKIIGFPSEELEGRSISVETCLIFGERSTYVSSENHSKVKNYFPKVSFAGIPNAGHWLHVEQPTQVLDALRLFLQKSEKNDR